MASIQGQFSTKQMNFFKEKEKEAFKRATGRVFVAHVYLDVRAKDTAEHSASTYKTCKYLPTYLHP